MSTQLDEPAVSVDVDVPAGVDMVTTLYIGPSGARPLSGTGRGLPQPPDQVPRREPDARVTVPPARTRRRADRRGHQGVCAVLDVGYRATASTLLRRRGQDHGIEADKTYYIGTPPPSAASGVTIDLAAYPPPDLAVEVVATHEPTKSLDVCRELGVPEVWVYRVKRRQSLEFLHLDAQGQYSARPASRAFPFLTPADVLPGWSKRPMRRTASGRHASAPGSATSWPRGI